MKALPAEDFRFEQHRYYLGEIELPSVTTVLAATALVDASRFTDAHRLRGTAVHLACEYDDLGDLNEGSLDPALVFYLAAWRRFRTETGFEPKLIEHRAFHRTHFYAGTIDRVGVAQGKAVVIDIKSGALEPAYDLQLAAYAGLLNEPMRYERWVVQVCDDGMYRIHVCGRDQFPADFGVFLSALAIFNWKKRCIMKVSHNNRDSVTLLCDSRPEIQTDLRIIVEQEEETEW